MVNIDKRQLDKISSAVITVFAIIMFITNYISANQTQIQGYMAVFGIPAEFQPAAAIIIGAILALVAYFNIKTPQEREDQRALEVKNELIQLEHAKQDEAEVQPNNDEIA